MQHLTSIVAANHQGVIGVRNGLPWRLKTDLRFFRQTTSGNVVIMGRKTFDSLGRRCLPHRENVVLTRGFEMFPTGPSCRSASSVPEGLLAAALAAQSRRECYVIGGASMYEQFAPYVDRYLITLVDKEVRDGDTFFPLEFLARGDEWELASESRFEANTPDDEVSFHIFEWVSKHGHEIRAERLRVIDEMRPRRPDEGRAARRRRTESVKPAYATML